MSVSPVPRRTYGRARNAAVDASGLSSETPTSLVYVPTDTGPSASPSKTLLNKFTARRTEWLDGLKEPQTSELDDPEDVELTDAEIKAAMERLRKNKAGDNNHTSRTLVAGVSSSSLSAIPPSSPPKVSSALRRQLANQGPTALAATDSSSSLSEIPPSSPPKVPAAPRGHTTHEASLSLSSAVSSSLTLSSTDNSIDDEPMPSARRPKRIVESDDDDDGPNTDCSTTPKAATSKSRVVVGNGGDDEDEVDQTIGNPFDDEDDGDDMSPVKKKPTSHMKPLNKVDRETLQRDIERAARDQVVEASRPEAKVRPVTTWMARAQNIANNATQPVRPSPPVYPSDDIQQFTPSSGPNNRRERFPVKVAATSSPTPGPSKVAFNLNDFDDDDEEDDTLHGSLDRRIDARAKQDRLKEAKLRALAAMNTKTALPVEDDDLIIIPEPKPEERPRLAFSNHKGPDARGKHVTKKTTTETHMVFAGRQFGHADLKQANGGTRPAGQKKGRDQTVTSQQVEAQILARHQEQVRTIVEQKEALYGKGRQLPPKELLDLSALLAEHSVSPDIVADSEDDDEDDDDDYAPEDADDEADDNAQGMMELSQTKSSHVDTISDEMESDDDKENNPGPSIPPEEEDETPLRLPNIRSTRRRVNFGSDNEDETPVKHDTALRDAVEGRIHAIPAAGSGQATSPGFDIAFGSGSFGGTGGFSQLFNETQAPNGAESVGFAALRDMPEAGFLPAHALLPSVNISETQKRRDNALIAGETENAEPRLPQSTKKQQYLNSQGFFTQTRPAGRNLTEPEDDLEVEMDEYSQVPTAIFEASSTLINSSTKGTVSSPTQGSSETFVRLRRRMSPVEGETQVQSPSPPPAPRPRNAFDALRAGARQIGARDAHGIDKGKQPAFLDEQAEESDEDNAWGFTGGKDDDENDDDLDNGYVPDLLDDANVTEEERTRQTELNAERFRQVEQEDDARREAEAKKVTEGHYRTKKRGNDFLSDEEDEGNRKIRLNKKQRRQRKLDGEDGLQKLQGEENVFAAVYNEDLTSDSELDEAPPSPTAFMSPDHGGLSLRERRDLLSIRARQNTTGVARRELFPEEPDEEDSQYAISNKPHVATTTEGSAANELELNPTSVRRNPTASRSTDRYAKFVSEETLNPRRNGAAGGVSVVVSKSTTVQQSRQSKGGNSKEVSRTVTRQTSSIHFDRTDRFR